MTHACKWTAMKEKVQLISQGEATAGRMRPLAARQPLSASGEQSRGCGTGCRTL